MSRGFLNRGRSGGLSGRDTLDSTPSTIKTNKQQKKPTKLLSITKIYSKYNSYKDIYPKRKMRKEKLLLIPLSRNKLNILCIFGKLSFNSIDLYRYRYEYRHRCAPFSSSLSPNHYNRCHMLLSCDLALSHSCFLAHGWTGTQAGLSGVTQFLRMKHDV